MALTDLQKAILQQKAREGILSVAEYIAVEWDEGDPSETRYYANTKLNTISPFVNIGFDVEPRLVNEPFRTMELYPDLRTDTIPVVFSDIDKAIKAKFQGFGSGARVEFFLYYPQVDGHHSVWFGQLQAPQVWNRKTTNAIATNGFRSREQFAPKRRRPEECSWTFGGLLGAEALETNGCIYNRHLDGSIGNLNGGVPYTTCPRDPAACAARGMSIYYGGFKPDAAAVVTDQRSGYLAVSKGNASSLPNPIRVIFGTKIVRGNINLFWRREMNAQNQEHGFVALVGEAGEGPIRRIRNVKVGEKLIEQQHLAWRSGTIGQSALTQYAPDISNFSYLAHFFARKGWVNPLNENANTLNTECTVEGYRAVTTFNVQEPGKGLLGRYYQDTGFASLVGERIDSTINFPQQSIPPMADIDYFAGFSVRWTGTITFDSTEEHTFTCFHDDQIEITINGDTVIDEAIWGTDTGTFTPPAADTPYTIQIDLIQNVGAGTYNPWGIVLEWESASLDKEVVPVTAFDHDGGEGYVRQWTNNRFWCLLEILHNQRFGLSYPLSRFNETSWINGASWSYQPVTFSYTNVDGETRSYSHTRTQLDVILEGRPVAEQIVDICRSGRFSVPFQKDGQFHVEPFRRFTVAELDAAKLFTDVGPNKNIFVNEDGEPLMTVSQIPDDKLVNEITLSFEDGANGDNERPITVDNPNQKLRAGRVLGEDNLQSIPMRFAAFGCRNLNEVIKLGYGLLRFGEFDEGGILNNLQVTMEAPLVEALSVQRYQCIKIQSDELDGFLLPINDEFDGFEQAEYFRVLRVVKTSRDTAQIVAQAYNVTAYANFETNSGVYPPALPPPNPFPDDIPPIAPPARVNLDAVDYDLSSRVLTLTTS